MDPAWESQFRRRMRAFELGHTTGNDGMPVSIKVRVTSGCFHREHSPQAYALIDQQLYSMPPDEAFAFEEHESGPEVLRWWCASRAESRGSKGNRFVLDLTLGHFPKASFVVHST